MIQNSIFSKIVSTLLSLWLMDGWKLNKKNRYWSNKIPFYDLDQRISFNSVIVLNDVTVTELNQNNDTYTVGI